MYKHILIPTVGSELSKLAIQEGVASAKALSARVTALAVTKPFHVFTTNPSTNRGSCTAIFGCGRGFCLKGGNTM
jgi:hypothetical protein